MQPKKIEDIDDLFDENDMKEKTMVDLKQRYFIKFFPLSYNIVFFFCICLIYLLFE